MTIDQIEEFLRRGQEAQKDIDRLLEEQKAEDADEEQE